MPITGFVTHSLAMVAPGADPATNAWVTAVVAAGGTVSAGRKTLVNNLITGLRTDGLFAKLDRLWLFAAENSQSALIDIIAASSASATNSPNFTVDNGYNGNGTSAFVNTNFNPTTGTPNFVQDSCHFSIWDNTGTDTDQTSMFGSISGNNILLSPNAGGVNINYRINGSANRSFPKTGAKGLVINNRSAAASQTLDQNGTTLETDTTTSNSVSNDTTGVLQYAATFFSSAPPAGHQISSCGLGGSLTATERTNLYNRIRTYMTAVGIP